MGAWGAGLLDDDGAWDYVGRLLAVPAEDRPATLLSTLENATRAAELDVDQASAGLMAALLVACARGPARLSDERLRIVEHAERVAGVDGFGGLLGSLTTLRTPAAAHRARGAVERIGRDSELADLQGAAQTWTAALDAVAAALTEPLERWPARELRGLTTAPLHRTWARGTVLAIDLGDDARAQALLLEEPFIAFYAGGDPLDGDFRAALFTVTVNPYLDRPAGWRTLGSVPADDVPGRPLQFRQDLVDPHRCVLVRTDEDLVEPPRHLGDPVFVSQQECVGLEHAGVGWTPEHCEERLRNLYAGRPDQNAEHLRVRISRSRVLVVPAEVADRAEREGHLPAEPDERTHRPKLHPAHDIPALAAAHGAGRDDLVVLEVDEAVGWPIWRPGGFPLGAPVERVLARYDLVPDGDGYRLDPPWNPRYP